MERCKIRSSRVLPHWKAEIKGTEIGRNTQVNVWYFYKSCRQYLKDGKLPVTVIYSAPNLQVMTMGINDISRKVELRRHNWQHDWESAESSRIEVGGGGTGEIGLELG